MKNNQSSIYFFKIKRSVLVFSIVLILCIGSILNFIPAYTILLNANWEFGLPIKSMCMNVYSADTGISSHGDGTRYHVFSYKNDSVIEDMLPWSYTESTTLSWIQKDGEEKQYYSYSECVCAWLANLNVPEKFLPEFEDVAYWYSNRQDNSEIIVIWDNAINKLYIIEHFI